MGACFKAAIVESKKVLNVGTPAINITAIVDAVIPVTQDKRGVLCNVLTDTEAPGIDFLITRLRTLIGHVNNHAR